MGARRGFGTSSPCSPGVDEARILSPENLEQILAIRSSRPQSMVDPNDEELADLYRESAGVFKAPHMKDGAPVVKDGNPVVSHVLQLGAMRKLGIDDDGSVIYEYLLPRSKEVAMRASSVNRPKLERFDSVTELIQRLAQIGEVMRIGKVRVSDTEGKLVYRLDLRRSKLITEGAR